MRAHLVGTALLVVAGASAGAQVPLIRNPSARRADTVAAPPTIKTETRTSPKSVGWTRHVVAADSAWCSPAPDANGEIPSAIRFCGFFKSSKLATAAANRFWDQGGGISFGRMLNVLGTTSQQSMYAELLSDTWNSVRVSLAGVKNTSADTAAGAQSKSVQYLNKGGPTVFGMQRPLYVITAMGSRTNVIVADYVSFNVAGGGGGAGSATDDSLKFNEASLNVQSMMDGAQKKINGIAGFHYGFATGGRAFYNAIADSRRAFSEADFTLGLVLEGTTQISWRRVILGPHKLMDGASLLAVNFTR